MSGVTRARRTAPTGHHVRERAALADACDGAALPAVVGPSVKHNACVARSADVCHVSPGAGRGGIDRVSCRRRPAAWGSDMKISGNIAA